MLRSTRTLAALLPLLLAGCFTDAGSGGTSNTTSGGSTTADDTTGSQISVSETAPPPTTGISAGTTSSSETEDTEGSGETGGTTADTDSGSSSGSESSDSDESSTGSDVLLVEELQPGDLIVTEIMANPNCTFDNCEWFEVLNTTAFPIELEGLRIGDQDVVAGNAVPDVIVQSAILEPNTRGVLALEDLWPYPDYSPLAVYNGVELGNSDLVTIGLFRPDDTVIDVAADFFPNEPQGRSRRLLPTALDAVSNDDDDNWCWSDTPLPSTSIGDDWGTPGYDADDCFPFE